MPTRHPLMGLFISAALALPGLILAGQAQADTVTTQTTLSYSGPLLVGSVSLKLENLAGHLSVTQGSTLQVTATVVAGGKDSAAAQALARSVRFDTSQSGSEFILHVHYPVEQYSSYSYPESDSKSEGDDDSSDCFFGIFCVNAGGSSLTYQGSEVHVYRNGSRGTPLHVDLAVQIPAGMKLALVNDVGLAEADGIHNDLQVKTSSADIHISDMHGQFSADTGSGDVHATDLSGDFTADTGSGDVFAERLSGNLHADTGSGDVHVSGAQSQTLYANTGSGDVSFNHVKGDMKCDTGSGDCSLDNSNGSLHADTGSGDVTAENYISGGSVWADTGSGDVRLSGDLSGLRKLYIDTGSGEALLSTSTGLSMHLVASSDSGDVSVKLPGLSNVTVKDSYFSGDIGKAEGQGSISTGSGDIDISHH